MLFPYEAIREEQERLIMDVKQAIEEEKNLIVHAPTGLGKTIAVLGPALKNAIERGRTVFFLTSRRMRMLLPII